ncbi:hypothetical protein B0T16DRAFT_391247 [Cercophora newfieldiana]|uniref:Uncharacterized protein n=1 Tax=Cercophora newfieldiana TaxID=92897 RepID=A0AA39Y6E0_9PEZI|nr:hypothetical protein B0T16DRAFT_391247 [Cercophora newfieldiana]
MSPRQGRRHMAAQPPTPKLSGESNERCRNPTSLVHVIEASRPENQPCITGRQRALQVQQASKEVAVYRGSMHIDTSQVFVDAPITPSDIAALCGTAVGSSTSESPSTLDDDESASIPDHEDLDFQQLEIDMIEFGHRMVEVVLDIEPEKGGKDSLAYILAAEEYLETHPTAFIADGVLMDAEDSIKTNTVDANGEMPGARTTNGIETTIQGLSLAAQLRTPYYEADPASNAQA